MTLIVETGTIVANANSYVSVADATDYASVRGLVFAGDVEQMLRQAMDYIEQQPFIGTKKTIDQPLQWPRYNAYIDGYLFPSDDIPQQLIYAQIEAALAIDAGNSPLNPVAPAVKRKKLDTLEIEYQSGASSATYAVKINNWLKKLIGGASGANVIKVSKA
jgi:hypothetical protein